MDKEAQPDKVDVDKQFANIIRHDARALVKLVKDSEDEEVKMYEPTHYFIRQESEDYLNEQNNTFSMQLIANCKIKPQPLVSRKFFPIFFLIFFSFVMKNKNRTRIIRGPFVW